MGWLLHLSQLDQKGLRASCLKRRIPWWIWCFEQTMEPGGGWVITSEVGGQCSGLSCSRTTEFTACLIVWPCFPLQERLLWGKKFLRKPVAVAHTSCGTVGYQMIRSKRPACLCTSNGPMLPYGARRNTRSNQLFKGRTCLTLLACWPQAGQCWIRALQSVCKAA